MKTLLTATAAALVGLSVMTAGPALAHKGHKHFKGGIHISLGHGWHSPFWFEPACFYKTVWVYSEFHGHKIPTKVLVCP